MVNVFFPFLRSKFYLRIFRVTQAESWHFWLFLDDLIKELEDEENDSDCEEPELDA